MIFYSYVKCKFYFFFIGILNDYKNYKNKEYNHSKTYVSSNCIESIPSSITLVGIDNPGHKERYNWDDTSYNGDFCWKAEIDTFKTKELVEIG